MKNVHRTIEKILTDWNLKKEIKDSELLDDIRSAMVEAHGIGVFEGEQEFRKNLIKELKENI